MPILDKLLSILRDNAWNGVAGIVALASVLFGGIRFIGRRRTGPKWFMKMSSWVRLNSGYIAFIMLTLTAAAVSTMLTWSYWAGTIIVVYALVIIFANPVDSYTELPMPGFGLSQLTRLQMHISMISTLILLKHI